MRFSKQAAIASPALALSALILPFMFSGCTHDAHSAIVQQMKLPHKGDVDMDDSKPSTGFITISADQMNEIRPTMALVQQQKIVKEVLLTGQVEPDSNMTTPVISLVPGRVEKSFVQLGDVVKQGQKLAFVRSDDIAQIEADLLKGVLDFEADVQQARFQLALCEKIFGRHKQLFSEGISARADLDSAESDYQKAQVALETLKEKRNALITIARERLRLYGVEKDELDRVLATKTIDDDFYIDAPRDGIITERNADIGQLIDNSHNIFVVTDLSQVWLTAQAFEKDIRCIKKGQKVSVTVNSYPDKVFQGKVDYTGVMLDTDTRTMPVRATVQNPQIILKPEMFANMHVQIGETEALSIPFESVRKTGEATVAYVVQGKNRFEERKIEVGRRLGNSVEILKGLRPGETVVAHGSLQLQG
ncbi:MAG: efflux RND transporter periplasmic adaptor subunit, partial [Candidatus Melainabacteria bacterium]|nr:efflux RND transporter periplasmic adaptor subunit [Candidatus Melainabacteria bacterium]